MEPADDPAAASCRGAADGSERALDGGAVQAVGLRSRDRDLRRSLPDPAAAVADPAGADTVRGLARRGAGGGRRHRGSRGGRRLAALQRLLGRRRRHRGAGLREPGRARGLRGAGAAGHRRPGEDRDRPLRGLLARDQAEGRLRARCDRMPHLQRPGRRRLQPGRRVSGRLVQALDRRAAGFGARPSAPSGRSADADAGRRRRRAAAHAGGRGHVDADPGAADRLAGRAAAARSAGGAKPRRARGGAVCRSPTGSVRVRPGCGSSSSSTGVWRRRTT